MNYDDLREGIALAATLTAGTILYICAACIL